METNVAFNSLGFHTLLILNKLRNEKQITEVDSADDDEGREEDREREETRAQLKRVNRRLRLITVGRPRK